MTTKSFDVSTCMFLPDTGNRLFSGSSDGRMVHWDPLKGDNDVVKGKAHTSQVQMLVPKGQDELISIGWDDQLKVISLSSEPPYYLLLS